MCLSIGLGACSVSFACTLTSAEIEKGKEPVVGGEFSEAAPFRAAVVCASCHPRHYEEWKQSMHAFGGSDPVMLAMAAMAEEEAGNSIGDECKLCHAPALSRQQQIADDELSGNFPEDLTHDGINCDVCHSFDVHPAPVADISFIAELDPKGPKYGTIENPVDNSFHESAYEASFGRARVCSPCHQINFDDGSGAENTFSEWESSIFPERGMECQKCHMRQSRGPAAVGGPDRVLHDHRFVGVDYATTPFLGVDQAAQKSAVQEVLGYAVFMRLSGVPEVASPGQSFVLEVVLNNGAGHAIPTGTSFAREMWIDVRASDGAANTFYRSGYLGPNGDLVSSSEDPDLTVFGSQLYDAEGKPTPFSWRAASIDESRMLAPTQEWLSQYTITLPSAVTGPVQLDVSVKFRPLRPSLLRELELEELLPIEVFVMRQETLFLAVDG